MRYRMICLDLDGTLLTDKKEIPQKTREALQQARRKGVKIVIATGRLLANAQAAAPKPVDYLIASNGAVCTDAATGETLSELPLSKELLWKLSGCIRGNGLSACFYSGNSIYATSRKVWWYYRWNMFRSRSLTGFSLKYMAPEKWEKALYDDRLPPMHKCNIHSGSENGHRRAVSVLKAALSAEIAATGWLAAEITAPGVTKGRAAADLAARLGLKREEVIAVGDSANDTSMLTYAGLGVAMANAEPAIRKAADYITGSNNENGVAAVIEKVILNSGGTE